MKDLTLKKILLLTSIIPFLIFAVGLIYLDISNKNQAKELFIKSKDSVSEGDADEALRLLNKAISYHQNSIYYYFKYEILKQIGKNNEADLNLERAIKIEPNNAYYLHAAGMLKHQIGDSEEGIGLLKKAIKLQPKNSDYKMDLSLALSDSGYSEESIKILEQILKNDSKYYRAWNQLASLYHYSGNDSKSHEVRKKAIEQFPDDPSHYFWYAVSCERQNLKEEAILAYKKSIELEPSTGTTAAYRIADLTGSKVDPIYEIKEDKDKPIPFIYRNNAMYIKAFVEDIEGIFLIDTGATSSHIYKEFLDKNDLYITGDAPVIEIETAGGIIQAPIYYSNFRVGEYIIRNVRTSILQDSSIDQSDGIIGQDILNQFKIEINYDNRTITLKS